MFCPNCGTQNAETAPACAKCGYQLKGGQVAAAPRFKGTMLMMNQPGAAPPTPGSSPPSAPPQANAPPQATPASGPAPSFQAEAPPIGAAPPMGAGAPSRLKGTMVGVAPPGAGAVAPWQRPEPHQTFGSPQGVNALAGTVALDGGGPPMFGLAQGADPNAPAPGGFGAPPPGAFGAPHPAHDFGAPAPGGPAPGGFGAPAGGPAYGAPPPQHDFGQQMNQGFQQLGQGFQQAGQPLDQAFNQGMQPYPQHGHMMPGQQPGGMMMPEGPPKSWMVTLLLCIFAGGIGVHRFYVGRTGSGIAQLLTLGGCGIWTLVDLVMILTDNFTDAQGRPLVKDS